MNLNVGCATDVGRKRSQNQDHVAALPDLGLFIVADGMGGHRGGETASRMAIEVVEQQVRQTQQESSDWNPKETIKRAIEAASQTIYKKALEDSSLQGMGTTTVALLFKNGLLTIGHVGDSRCYFLRPGAIWQITRDHSLVQEKLRAGLITRAELKTDRMKNVITRSVGFEFEVNVEIFEMNAEPGDVFLVCSDGLSGLLEDDQILNIFAENEKQNQPPSQIVERLIEAANTHGGDDNISTILIQVMKGH
ncbi:Stp1/IreP family PP2C-type Ser/Thr phosphatase [Bdellovibrionota bacterium FG-1]